MSNNRKLHAIATFTGCGGIGCPCCNAFGASPRKTKKKYNRKLRRKLKLLDKKDNNNANASY